MFKMEINTGGAAYCEPLDGSENEFFENLEVARNLMNVRDAIIGGRRNGSVIDTNGNKVGTWELM